jgi:glycosyltransferase involved in cell wall biosynthesis
MNIFIVGGRGLARNQIRPEYEPFIRMAQLGHNLTVVVPPDSPYKDRLLQAGIRVLDCYPTSKICISSIRAMRRELRSKDYDIIYATNSKTIPNAAFAAIGFPAKMIAYRGTTGGLYRHDPTAYLTILHPRIDGVICVSDAVRQDVSQQVWGNHDQVVTIYKGHNPDWYQIQPANLREFEVDEESFLLICAVNVRPSKGIDIMLDAANSLAKLKNLHLLLIGNGMDQEPYTSMITNNAMGARIHVCGFRQDAPELIAASDVLVQPSRSGEGLPRAMMEAMCYGTPVIITETGGGKEVVEDGKSGFVVPVENSEAIRERVTTLYNNPELLAQMSVAAKHQIEQNFNSEQTADKMTAYFQHILAN